MGGDFDDDDKTPPRSRRAGSPRASSHWGDDKRAAVGRDHRTPAFGTAVPHDIATEQTAPRELPPKDSSEFTPVKHILDTVDDPQLKRVLRAVWAHMANVEMRSDQRIGDDAVRSDIDRVEKKTNKLYDRAWWAFTVFVGALGAAAVKLVIIGRSYGAMESELKETRDRVQLVEEYLFLRDRVAPALLPGKDPQ